MAREVNYTFGCSPEGYGWAGCTPTDLIIRFKALSRRFGKLVKKHQIDAIAFTGSSGCAGAFALATKYSIPLIYVRKKTEKSNGNKIEFNGEWDAVVKNYIIVDDFVSTGATIETIVKAIDRHTRDIEACEANLIGVLCYDEYHDKDRTMSIKSGDYTIFAC